MCKTGGAYPAVQNSGSMIATGCGGKNADVVLWDFASGQARARFQEHDLEVVMVAFSPDDRLLLTVGHEKWVMVYACSSGRWWGRFTPTW